MDQGNSQTYFRLQSKVGEGCAMKNFSSYKYFNNTLRKIVMRSAYKIFGLITSICISTAAWAWTPDEFQNYFKEMPLQEARLEIEQTMQEIFSRLTMKVGVDGKVKTVRIFDWCAEIAAKEGAPDAHFYAGGGVIRSAHGYIYEEIRKQKLNHPNRPMKEVFENLRKHFLKTCQTT
jgi:hypothetical protein